MITIREILDKEMNGRNTIKEQKELNAIAECVDSLTGVFVGTKLARPIINEMSNVSSAYLENIKKAMNTLEVYENKCLNEEEMTKSAARILAYDIDKYLKESYDALTAQKRAFKEMDKSGVSKVYSIALFELEKLCRDNDIVLEDFITDTDLVESVSNDMSKIIGEVL